MRLNNTDALFRQAVEHQLGGRLLEALPLYDAVLRLAPKLAAAHCNRAIALQSLNRLDEALSGYDRAIQLQPDYADAYYNKGIALKHLHRIAEAVRCYDRAIALKPDHVEALTNRGNALRDLDQPAKALESFNQVIALSPALADGYFNRANALVDLMRLQEALQSFDKAIALKPNHVEAFYNKSTCTLLSGDWQAGWPLYEWRKKWAMSAGLHSYPTLEWTGRENLEGKTLFIHAEQGLGDTIQFCRYALLAKEKGARVILAVQAPLIRLLKSLTPEIEIEKLSAPSVSFDHHIALLSMPLAFGTTLATCPAKVPYLRAEPEKVATWKARIGNEGLKIGICWQGSKQSLIDFGRSFSVRHFEAIARLPNVRLLSLQKNDGIEQLRDLPSGMNIETLGEEFDAGPDAFIDSAAVMECLDLIITSDTAIAHLAGALGRPAWVALKYVPDWRWLLDRSDSPWYPTLQLFRQPAPGDWPGAFAAIQAQLAAEHARRPTIAPPETDADWLFRQAVEHQRHGRLTDALTLYDSAISAKPNVAVAYYNRGVVLHLMGKVEDALRSYDRAIALQPDKVEAHYNRAIALKALGRLEEAARSYDQAIALNPAHANAYNNRGNILQELGRPDEALRSLDTAIALKPDFAEAHNNRARALQDLGRLSEALESFNRAIALKPAYAEAYNNLGNALRSRGRFEEALRSYDSALAVAANYPEAHYNRAGALLALKAPEAALESYDRAIALNPRFTAAYTDKGHALKDLGRMKEAFSCFSRAVELMPDNAGAHNNQGNALLALKLPQEALHSFDRAIALDSDYADAYSNKGNALLVLGRPDEALPCYERALKLNPHHAEALYNKGSRLHDLGRLDEAIECFDKAIAIKPEAGEPYFGKSRNLLLRGDWAAGWPLYEWRKRKPTPTGLRICPQPEWTGKEGLEGKTLFIHAEQGLGDTIQFCRYALLARTKGARVILGVQDALVCLLKSLGPQIEVVPETKAPEAFDYHIALMSMPLAFATMPDTCPAEVPYLHAEPENVAKWQKRIGSEGFKIGISWQGNRQSEIDVGRSFPVRHFEAIAGLPNVRLISLQKNDGVEQLRDLPAGMTVETLGDAFDPGPDAFVDTAAVMECLDLVITPDTAIAHLAGALGCPAWIALKHVPDWRWLLDRADSPWYPTLKLFRQPAPGDWPGVFAAMEAKLTRQSRRRAIEGPSPKEINAIFARAVEHHARGRLLDALALYEEILRFDPKAAAAHGNRGIVLQSLGRFDEAIRSYDCALQVQPNFAEAYNNKANALHELARSAEALPNYDKALALKPGFAEAHHNKGKALQALKRLPEAVECYDRATRLRPDYADAYYNKGNALQELQRSSEALQNYDRSIALKPDFAEAHTSRGNALKDLKRLNEALASYDRAIAIRGEFPDAYWNKGICLLLAGHFEEGWPFYEWRKKRAKAVGSRSYPQPEWAGKESLEGKTLFIHAEQGLGDIIQFCRYARIAREMGAKVILGAPDVLMHLLKGLGPDIEIIPLTAKPFAFDYHIALMSMPLAFGTAPGTCPAMVPYLHAEPERVAMWKRRIGSEGFKIGICWQGNKQAEVDVGRSIPLRQFEALAQLPNVRLISLQKNDGVEQLRDLPSGMKVETLGEEFDAGPDGFVDTAAAMECLDLVITSDTAIAHLAGALGRPAWVALKYVPDWRWLLDRSDSPWYPTLRLFRQPAPGDWAGVFADIQAHLAEQVS